jgi:hypothetical protein
VNEEALAHWGPLRKKKEGMSLLTQQLSSFWKILFGMESDVLFYNDIKKLG